MSADAMPPLPVDAAALDAIEHALGGALDLDEETGELVRVGAEYGLHQLLDFWAGRDHDDRVLDGYAEDGTPIYWRDQTLFSEHDLLRALIAEVRRLRTAA